MQQQIRHFLHIGRNDQIIWKVDSKEKVLATFGKLEARVLVGREHSKVGDCLQDVEDVFELDVDYVGGYLF